MIFNWLVEGCGYLIAALLFGDVVHLTASVVYVQAGGNLAVPTNSVQDGNFPGQHANPVAGQVQARGRLTYNLPKRL